MAVAKIQASISDSRVNEKKDSLIKVLLARGRWAARQGEVEAALSEFDEALGYAVCSGYRLYKIDILICLAWAHLNEGNSSVARSEAERSRWKRDK